MRGCPTFASFDSSFGLAQVAIHSTASRHSRSYTMRASSRLPPSSTCGTTALCLSVTRGSTESLSQASPPHCSPLRCSAVDVALLSEQRSALCQQEMLRSFLKGCSHAGNVPRTAVYTLDQIKAMPSQTLPVTLVCAGNRRKEQNMVKQSIGYARKENEAPVDFTAYSYWTRHHDLPAVRLQEIKS